MNNTPFAILKKGALFPSLRNEQALEMLPSIVVDMGAIPHIINGADIMRPGIREIKGEFQKGDVIVVKDLKFGKPVSICVAEVASESMRTMPKGKAAENVHYVGDPFWNVMKSI
jgi:PUA domain protein